MDVRIHYRHISHGKSSTEMIQNWITDFFGKAIHLSPLMERRGLAVEAYLSKARVRDGSSKAMYECHLLARAPWLKKDLFAKFNHANFWSALTGASHVLKKQIVKDRLQRKTSRQRNGEDLSKVG